MIEMKAPRTLILLALIGAVAGALLVAGCGGGGSGSSASTSVEESPSEPGGAIEEGQEPAEEETEGGAEEGGGAGATALSAEGKTIFSSNCASCHTLKAANANGEVGPNLDELEPDLATVEHQVINGGGGMPAFGKEKILSSEEIKAVSTYVSTVAGQG
jgi:mono/diheme cytochrome c family protein